MPRGLGVGSPVLFHRKEGSGGVLESAETPPWAESLQGVISKDPSVRNANFLAPNNGEDMQFRFEHAQFTFSEKFDRSHTKT